MKFSVIVPVYNVENYIEKCLASIANQTYNNYEVIIVDDGSPDNSANLIKNFIKDKANFKYFKKENGGLSDARNYGIKKAHGDYILFVDSDDYIEPKLLESINDEIDNKKIDVIKFGCHVKTENDSKEFYKGNFSNLNAKEAFEILKNDEALEPAWLYSYRSSFWKENNFAYTKGRIHEDFGLTPIILAKANSISSIPYIGYNYVIRENSIMTAKDEEKDYKKFLDKIYFFDTNIELLEKEIGEVSIKKYLKSFYSNNIILTAYNLGKDNRKKAIVEIRKRHLDHYLLDDTFKRKIKKMLFKLSNSIYINWVMKLMYKK